MNTAILILNWNGAKDTVNCLRSLLPVMRSKDYLFIIDNGSTDNSVKEIEQYLLEQQQPVKLTEAAALKTNFDSSQKIYLVKNLKNLGFGGGNNTVLKQLKQTDSNFELAWLLNNDTTVTAQTLESLRASVHSNETIAVVGSLILNEHNKATIQCAGVNYYKWLGVSKLIHKNLPYEQLDKTKPISFDYLNGASLMFRLSALERSGYFDERFFLYSEELDLQLRLQQLDYRLQLDLNSLVYHQLSGGTSSKKHLFYYYYNQSAVLLSKKHFAVLCTVSAIFSLAAITFIRTFPSLKNFSWGLKGISKGIKNRY